MKTLFTTNNIRTHFPSAADTSIILSFNQMISQLTEERFSSTQQLNNYKNYLSTIKKNVYINSLSKVIDSLLMIYKITPVTTQLFPSLDITIKSELTSTLYSQFLENENINMDPAILNIFKEIKSLNII
jgi:hypothetical protein